MNWIIGTKAEWEETGYVLPDGARAFMMDTPNGEVEVYLQHVELGTFSEADYENIMRKMPKDNFIGSSTLQWLLPPDEE